jgi:hypothetical protein
VKAGQTLFPLARGLDDFAVRSATLLLDGKAVATTDEAPYAFSFTPGAEYGGRTVTLATIVTDSAGQSTTSAGVRVAVAKVAAPTPPTSVGPLAPTLKVVKVVKRPKAGTAALVVSVNTPGTVTLTGAKVARSAKAVRGTVQVPVRLKPAVRRTLRQAGHVKVKVRITFTSSTGATVATTKSIVVRRKR